MAYSPKTKTSIFWCRCSLRSWTLISVLETRPCSAYKSTRCLTHLKMSILNCFVIPVQRWGQRFLAPSCGCFLGVWQGTCLAGWSTAMEWQQLPLFVGFAKTWNAWCKKKTKCTLKTSKVCMTYKAEEWYNGWINIGYDSMQHTVLYIISSASTFFQQSQKSMWAPLELPMFGFTVLQHNWRLTFKFTCSCIRTPFSS